MIGSFPLIWSRQLTSMIRKVRFPSPSNPVLQCLIGFEMLLWFAPSKQHPWSTLEFMPIGSEHFNGRGYVCVLLSCSVVPMGTGPQEWPFIFTPMCTSLSVCRGCVPIVHRGVLSLCPFLQFWSESIWWVSESTMVGSHLVFSTRHWS